MVCMKYIQKISEEKMNKSFSNISYCLKIFISVSVYLDLLPTTYLCIILSLKNLYNNSMIKLEGDQEFQKCEKIILFSD